MTIISWLLITCYIDQSITCGGEMIRICPHNLTFQNCVVTLLYMCILYVCQFPLLTSCQKKAGNGFLLCFKLGCFFWVLVILVLAAVFIVFVIFFRLLWAMVWTHVTYADKFQQYSCIYVFSIAFWTTAMWKWKQISAWGNPFWDPCFVLKPLACPCK